jgi:hypothetical protein
LCCLAYEDVIPQCRSVVANPGVPAEVLERVFEPFFGLAISFGLVRAMPRMWMQRNVPERAASRLNRSKWSGETAAARAGRGGVILEG